MLGRDPVPVLSATPETPCLGSLAPSRRCTLAPLAQALAGGMRGVVQDWELMLAQLETQVGYSGPRGDVGRPK